MAKRKTPTAPSDDQDRQLETTVQILRDQLELYRRGMRLQPTWAALAESWPEGSPMLKLAGLQDYLWILVEREWPEAAAIEGEAQAGLVYQQQRRGQSKPGSVRNPKGGGDARQGLVGPDRP